MKSAFRFALLLLLLAPVSVRAENPSSAAVSQVEQAARDLVGSYVDDYNAGDATALATRWASDATYNNHTVGTQLKGRAEIEKYMAGLFAGKKQGVLTIRDERVHVVTPGVALLNGTSLLTEEGVPPQTATFSAVLVQRDGQWLIDRATENLVASADNGAAELQKLNWMVGSWTYESDNGLRVETDVKWVGGHQWLNRSFRVVRGEKVELTGTELIGFDFAKQAICSWDYDSDGSRGEGVWKKDGDRWLIQETGFLASQGAYSATNVIRLVNDNAFVWQATDREIAGENLPDTREVLVARSGTIDTATDAE